MKNSVKTLLLAVAMGMMLPALLFNVAERIILSNGTGQAAETTGQTGEDMQDAIPLEDKVIAVLLSDGTLQQMQLEDYLVGVVLGEMPADFHTEALKAQAVVARTYTLKRKVSGEKHAGGAVCTDPACCQAYCAAVDYLLQGGALTSVNNVTNAVQATAGQVLTYEGSLIEATYFSCSGGRTEDALAVWGTDIPYLQAVDSPGEEIATHYSERVEFSAAEFARLIEIENRGAPAMWFGRVIYTTGGGVETMYIQGQPFLGTELRKKLELRSTAFSVTVQANTISITTRGYGHRVGMSQYGAEAMARSGSGYQQILSHYYPGTELKNGYNQN